MNRILTQEEIDRLVQSLENPENESGADEELTPEDVKAYDFRNPTKLSKEQLQLLQQTCSRFFHHIATFFSAKTRRIIEVKLDSIDELPYQDFVRSIPLPCLLVTLGMANTNGICVLHIDLPVAYVFYDILCGGAGKQGVASRNTEPTDVELRVIRRIMQDALQQTITLAGENTSLALDMRSIETSPHNIQGLAINDTAVLASCTISVGDISGGIYLAIPFENLKPMLGDLALSSARHSPGNRKPTVNSSQIMDAPVRYQVVLAEIELTVNDLLELQTGDLISLDVKPGDPIDVVLGGRPRFQGTPGVHGDHLAVRISGKVEPHRRSS